MALHDVIEFMDPTGEVMIYRIPPDGSGEFRLNSQLIVQENQIAIFYKDGRALDSFGPGRHSLQTDNLPMLGSVIGAAFGGKSPFRASVYFVGENTFTNMGWGTPHPVMFRDTDLRMVALRAHGAFAVRIEDPRLFLNTLVGTQGVKTTWALEEYLRRFIVSAFAEVLGAKIKTILDLPVEYLNIAATLKNRVREYFRQYGVEIVDLVLEAVTPPSEVQEMLNRATGVAAQDISSYQAVAMADALRDAAKNPGTGGDGVGMGLGMGGGMAMARQFAQTEFGEHGPSHKEPAVTSVRAKLQELKQLLDDGLISEDEYQQSRLKILEKIGD